MMDSEFSGIDGAIAAPLAEEGARVQEVWLYKGGPEVATPFVQSMANERAAPCGSGS